MKINPSSAYFYNASSRINTVNHNSKILNTKQISGAQGNEIKNTESNAASAGNNYSGIQQTRISADNSYQKTMISDPRFAMERMASKLIDKLPDILNDMRNIPDTQENAFISEAQNNNTVNNKITISEGSTADYQGNAAVALQDISL